MISRNSSGSSRADSAVEPTRSQNITVSWRRSAASWGISTVVATASDLVAVTGVGVLPSSWIARSNLRRWPSDTTPVLVGQLSNDAFIDVVFDEAFRVL